MRNVGKQGFGHVDTKAMQVRKENGKEVVGFFFLDMVSSVLRVKARVRLYCVMKASAVL